MSSILVADVFNVFVVVVVVVITILDCQLSLIRGAPSSVGPPPIIKFLYHIILGERDE